MVTSTQLAPESLVARIIGEIESNPEAQRLLLRALLTEEFLRIPERLDRIEAELEVARTERADARTERADIRAELEIARTEREIARTERAEMRNDIAVLKGDSLEIKMHRSMRSLASQRLGLYRTRIVQSAVQDTRSDFYDAIDDALERGDITDEQRTRLDATDIILKARRKSDRARVWVAVEVSNTVGQRDIERARESADALKAMFGQDAEAVAAGYRIHPTDADRAQNLGVRAFLVPESRY